MSHISDQKFAHIARPYAQAAFEFAQDQHQLADWKAFLHSAATMAKEHDIRKLLANPEIASDALLQLFQDVLQSQLNDERRNFLTLIAQHDRFIALPEIADLYNDYYAALEKISNVRVITAVQIDDEFKHKLAEAISKRTQHEVTLHCDVDPGILGGAVIHIGDRVIDGSVRGKLTRLLEYSLR